MARDHFAQLNRQTSHRHDSPSDSSTFNKDFGAICGMLYSIVTLKAFFPKSPVQSVTNNPVSDSAARYIQEQLPLNPYSI
jgi:hypothetical protein